MSRYMNINSGAVCWICLEGGADNTGKSIVRDCACRGSDAGFAHTSCIIKYAEQKSLQATDPINFAMPWEVCPICKKGYQDDPAMVLAKAFVSFAERIYDYPGNGIIDKMKVMDALRLQITSIRCGVLTRGNTPPAVQEIKILIRKMLDMVDRAKEEHGIMGWVHMDHSTVEFCQCRHICCEFEAYGYICLGQLHLSDTSEKSREIEIGYYEKARDIYNFVGAKEDADEMSNLADRAKAKYEKDDAGELEGSKNVYINTLQRCGETSEQTLMAGVSYASSLLLSNFSIDAERLVARLSGTCRQVYGQEHPCTKVSVKLLNNCKRRFVHKAPTSLVYGDAPMRIFIYEALRYENDGEICIIAGPITTPRILLDENVEGQICGIPSVAVIPAMGCPVICHGLMNASHLNGKLGEVRSASNGKGGGGELRLGVYFEDKSLKSAAVKPENLRIAFVLPIE